MVTLRYVHVLISEIHECDLFGKWVFIDIIIKDLEMTSSWIIWVGPKNNDKCPNKRQHRREAEEEAAMWDWSDAAISQEHLETPETGRGKERNLP